MAKSIGSMSVLLTLNAKGFVKGMQQAMSGVNRFRAIVRSATGAVFNFRNLLLAGSGAAIAHFIDRSLQAADAQIDLAKTLNTSVKGLQALQMVAKEAGIDSESLTTALQFMTRTLGKVGGSNDLRGIFKELGLSFKDLKGLKADEQFKIIAERLGQVDDANKRAAMSAAIFGRGAGKLSQLMGDNNDKLAESRRFIESAGLAWDDRLSPGIERANDALQRAKSVFKGVAVQLAVQLAPVIEAASNAFIKWATSGGGVANMVSRGLDEVLITSTALLRIWDGFRLVWNEIEAALSQFFANFLRGYAVINNAMSNLLDSVGLEGQAQKFAVTPADVSQIDALEKRAQDAALLAGQLRGGSRADDLIREVQALRAEFARAAIGIEKLPRGVQ